MPQRGDKLRLLELSGATAAFTASARQIEIKDPARHVTRVMKLRSKKSCT